MPAVEDDARRRWTGAALRSGALLVVPVLVWLALPSPAAPPPLPDAPEREDRVAQRPAAARPVDTARARPASARREAVDVGAREGGIEGEVQDPDGKPIAGASVVCVVGEREQTAESDEAGKFRMAADAAGCKAIARRQGFAASEEAELRAGGANRLRLSPPTGIAGTVVDETGAPLPTFWIAAGLSAAGADAGAKPAPKAVREVNDGDGAFELSDLAPGRYFLAASAPPKPIARVDGIEVAPRAMTKGVRIVVAPGRTVVGTITDAATNEPVSGAMVFADRDLGLPAMPGFGAKGEFRFEGAPAEPFNLHVVHPSYVEQVTSVGRASADKGPVRVNVVLQRVHGGSAAPR